MRKSFANPFNSEGELAEVNVVPLADVCLTLVIIIMLISPMVLEAMIQVQASQAVATQRAALVQERPLFVDITDRGFTLNNKKLRSEHELFRALQHRLHPLHQKTVLISAAPEVRYEYVVRILDIIRQSGALSLSLVPRRGVKV